MLIFYLPGDTIIAFYRILIISNHKWQLKDTRFFITDGKNTKQVISAPQAGIVNKLNLSQ